MRFSDRSVVAALCPSEPQWVRKLKRTVRIEESSVGITDG